MTANRTYSIGQIAAILGTPAKPLPVSTVRGWVRQFAEHLSPGANPERGAERRFDDKDLATLRLVATLRDDHIPLGEVSQRLSETTVTAHEVIADSTPVPTESLPVPTGDATTALALPTALGDIDTRLRAVEARQAAQTWRSTPALWLAVGVVLGAVIGATIVIMALQLMR